MFDEVYEKMKRVLLPSKKENISPQDKVGTKIEEDLTSPEKSTEKTNLQSPSSPAEKVVLPSSTPSKPVPVKLQTPEGASSSKKILSPSEQRKLLEERRRIPGWILFLKYFSLLLAFFAGISFLWLKADLEENNKYFSIAGLKENVGLKFKNLTKQQKGLEQQGRDFESKIRKITQQLESQQYSIYTDSIRQIREGQLTWFDKKNANDELEYGILDGPNRMQDYFNSSAFQHPILSSTGNSIFVDNIYADRGHINFSVAGSHLFGKVFSLNSEFIKMINSFPLFKNGELKNFSKKKDSEGNETMTFSTKLEIQKKGEPDPADENFLKYEKWLLTQPSF